jgi:regulator of ribosome biosynthesis
MAVSRAEGNLAFDLGNLAAYDISTLTREQLEALTTRNLQAIYEKFSTLEREEDDKATYVKLPQPEVLLPKKRNPPPPKAPTKWEQYRKERGMGGQKKRSRMVYESTVDDFVPRWGKGSVKKIQDKNQWVMDDKDGQDPFQAKFEAKQMHKLKQKKRELKNSLAAPMESKKDRQTLNTSIKIAEDSTASMGRFDPKQTRKRKEPMKSGSAKEEQRKYLELLKQVPKKK